MTPPASAAAQPVPRVAPPRPRTAPKRPRRVSGPSRPAPARPGTRGAEAEPDRQGLIAGLLRVAESLSSHRLLDRLIRGRMWIGIVAFALIGIVTLQLGLLKLNSGIGRSLEREATLQRADAALSIENSELASGTRVEAQAERLGMRVSAVSSLHFLSSHPRSEQAAKAAAALRKPLDPVSEPPGEAETPATETEAASSAGSEPSSTGEPSSGEAAAQTKGGEEAPAATSTGTTESSNPGTPTGESASTAAPSGGATTGAAAPVSSEAHLEAGGGAAAP